MLDAAQTVKSSVPPVLRSGIPEHIRVAFRIHGPEEARMRFGFTKRRSAAPVPKARKSVDMRMAERNALDLRASARKILIRKKDDEETSDEIAVPKAKEPIDPLLYSSRFRLHMFEVKHILRLLGEPPPGADDIDKGDFRDILASIYDTSPENLAAATVKEAWEALLQDRARSERTGKEHLEDFFHWYTQNFFTRAIRGQDVVAEARKPSLWHKALHQVIVISGCKGEGYYQPNSDGQRDTAAFCHSVLPQLVA